MSIENVKAFIAKLKDDAALLDSFQKASDPKARQAVIEKAGFEFSQEEFKASTSELSDEDLNSVSGGAGYGDIDEDERRKGRDRSDSASGGAGEDERRKRRAR